VFVLRDIYAVKHRETLNVSCSTMWECADRKRSKARICGFSPAAVAGSSPAEGMDICAVFFTYIKMAKYRTVKTKTEVRMKYRLQENAKKNPPEPWIFFSSSGRGLRDGPILHPGESYRLCLYHCAWSRNVKSEAAMARVGLLRQTIKCESATYHKKKRGVNVWGREEVARHCTWCQSLLSVLLIFLGFIVPDN
jgi:hypothetical protein